MKIKKFVKSFTIDEKKWGRATEHHDIQGLMRDSDTGKQCCLGMYLTACGFEDKDLNEEPSGPKSKRNDGPEFWNTCWPKKNTDVLPSVHARGLAEINDAKMKLPTRKKAIIEGFKRLGVTVKFK